jgi:hypothetical protein
MLLYLICSSELEMVVSDWLRKLEPSFYRDGISKLKNNMLQNHRYSTGIHFKIMIRLCLKLPTFNLELNCI